MIDPKAPLDSNWSCISSNLKELVTPQQYKTWFQTMSLHSFTADEFTFTLSSKFLCDWIMKYYIDVLRKSVDRAIGGNGELTIKLEPRNDEQGQPEDATEPQDKTKASENSVTPEVPGTSGNAGIPRNTGTSGTSGASGAYGRSGWNGRKPVTKNMNGFYVNPKYNFDNYVVGPCNQLSYAAALAVSEKLGHAYNPLFLHGASGLGKTHLLQSICNKLLLRDVPAKILHLSCETFINHFISAVEKGDLDNFRTRYRHIDILLIDDIHLLANKERTQEEFFHTFNSLFNSGKQLVITSDSYPSEIPTLQERLVSRFKWGLVTQIYPPDFETRCAILKMKSKEKGQDLPDDVITFLSENIETNIRELEGAITKVIGYATLMNCKLDLEMAYEAMKDVIKTKDTMITIDNIVKVTTENYNVKLSDLQSKKRTQSIAVPRQIAMYMAKKLTNHSLQEIGAYFGGRDHSTVLHAFHKVSAKRKEDDIFKKNVDNLIVKITR